MDFGCFRIWIIGPVDGWEALGSSYQVVHIERFILPCPNLISIEGLGTLPEHWRSLGNLLGLLPIFRRDCSSLPSIWNVSGRGMPSHSIFDDSFYIGVPCLPHVRLGLMMLVSLTHHSYITVISLWLYASCYVEVELCFRFQVLSEFSATQDYIRQSGPFVIAGDRLHHRPPQLMLQVVVVILSTRLVRVWALDLFACFLTDSSHLFLRAISHLEINIILHWFYQNER